MIVDEKRCLMQRGKLVMGDEMWTDWKVEVEAVGLVGSRWEEVTFGVRVSTSVPDFHCAIVGPPGLLKASLDCSVPALSGSPLGAAHSRLGWPPS